MNYQINFTIDTGYDLENHVCIVAACNEEDAKKKFNNWILPRLYGERFVVDSETKITELDYSDCIYHNYFTNDD